MGDYFQQREMQCYMRLQKMAEKTCCILHQNALHLAPKRTAFSTKMQFNMLQIAIFWCRFVVYIRDKMV